MTRALLGFVVLVAVMAVIASDQTKPLLVTENLHHADFPLCVTINPGPPKPPARSVFNPRLSEKV
jgi:hypothetical protein